MDPWIRMIQILWSVLSQEDGAKTDTLAEMAKELAVAACCD